jgi:thioredoxin-related protein
MKAIILSAGILFSTLMHAQDMTKFHLYTPEANAKKEIDDVVKQAKKEGKHVLIQVGGNWCIWCARFNDFVSNDPSLDSLVKSDYVTYHLNYSKENKNEGILAKYGFPQRFGFPVFLILNDKGELIHTQNSGYLESGKSYDKEKVKGFFSDWNKKALDPAQYKEQ